MTFMALVSGRPFAFLLSFIFLAATLSACVPVRPHVYVSHRLPASNRIRVAESVDDTRHVVSVNSRSQLASKTDKLRTASRGTAVSESRPSKNSKNTQKTNNRPAKKPSNPNPQSDDTAVQTEPPNPDGTGKQPPQNSQSKLAPRAPAKTKNSTETNNAKDSKQPSQEDDSGNSDDFDPPEEENEDDFGEFRSMSATEMIAEARAQSRKYMKGGVIQILEWAFVFILVAPGTFPIFGCIILTCAAFWRRRLGYINSVFDAPAQSNSALGRSQWQTPVSYQRTAGAEHGALVVRARSKNLQSPTDGRDNDVS